MAGKREKKRNNEKGKEAKGDEVEVRWEWLRKTRKNEKELNS